MKIIDMKDGESGYIANFAIIKRGSSYFVNTNHTVVSEPGYPFNLLIKKDGSIFFDPDQVNFSERNDALGKYFVHVYPMKKIKHVKDMLFNEVGYVGLSSVFVANVENHSEIFVHKDSPVYSSSKSETDVEIVMGKNRVSSNISVRAISFLDFLSSCDDGIPVYLTQEVTKVAVWEITYVIINSVNTDKVIAEEMRRLPNGSIEFLIDNEVVAIYEPYVWKKVIRN